MAEQQGGMSYRNIYAPPLGARLRYYLGGRLPVEYRDWIEADIASSAWPWRGALLTIGGMLVGAGLGMLLWSGSWGLFVGIFIGAGLVSPINYVRAKSRRETELERHRRYWGEH